MNAAERKEYRKLHKNATDEDLVKTELTPYYYGKIGDKITVVSDDAGAWKIVVTCENAAGERFIARWDELNII